MLRCAAAAALLAASSGAALAIDLPRFDVGLHCASAGSQKVCRETERAAKAGIEARWSDIPEQRRHFCVQTEAFRPRPRRSYAGLAECLADEKVSS